jgi:hypothetical protein
MKQEDKIAKQRILEKIKLIRSSGGSINPNETKAEQKERIERAKKDVKFCVEYYFPHYATSECAAFHLEWANKVKRDKHFTGFAKWGRGQAKSVWNNVIIPFWLWMNEGDQYFVLIGQNEKRAQQLLEDIRLEFEVNPRITNDFGPQKKLGSWEDGFFITQGGFIGQALGLGQSCRGLRIGNKRPKLINVDDSETKKTIKNEKIQDEYVEWFEQELLPTMDGEYERAMVSNNWFAAVMYIRKLAAKHPDWFVHEVMAYDPVTFKPTWHQKYDDQYFRKKSKKMGTLAAEAEYCHKVHIRGKIFVPEETQWCKLPRIDHFEAIVGHWDVAYAGNEKSDYNAVRLWGLYQKQFYYITSFVKQTKMRAAIEFIYDFQKNKPDSCILHWQFEAQFWNDEIERTLNEVEEAYGFYTPIEKVVVPKGKKYDRILTLKPYYQNNRIWYNEKMICHNDTLVGLAQLYGIEPGYTTKDDAPDADEQAIKKLETFIYSNKTGNMKSGKVQRKHLY